MILALSLMGGAAALELGVHLSGRWPRVRTPLALLALGTQGFAVAALVIAETHVFTLLIVFLSLYRLFNMARVVKRRMHEYYLRTATRRTSLMLIVLQLAVLGIWWIWEVSGVTAHAAWTALGLLLAGAGMLCLASAVRTLKRTAWPLKQTSYSDAELPSVTVAIPARNETEDLQQCLQGIISSDYPKLEIIVLDDCSQTARTPEIIRDFAHDGVRFIQGQEPAATWLPKNQAYDRLTDEASGAYILFCGVDVRFAPHSIRDLVSTMLDRNKQMLCILPLRQYEAYGQFSLVQAMRYWWELALPRRIFRRPPVLSTCWAIKADALKKAGGFASVARAIVPEAHFARELIKIDGYSFLRSGKGLAIESNKRIPDQRNTAVRMRYPQLHRRPEHAAVVALLEAVFLILPFVLALGGFWFSIGTVAHIAAVAASILFVIAYEITVLSTHVNTWWFGLFAQPFAAASDIVLMHHSMWKYEFSTVDWKGRNVCIPVMRVEPRLPTLG
ncbi:MAG: glycosyltransferase family 2 protein [Patescibacteria group bacterium]